MTSANAPQMNQRLGFEPNANDADADGDTRESRLTWIDMTHNSYQYANTLGSAILEGDVLVDVEEQELPSEFSIESVYPNPFNPAATALQHVRQPGSYALPVFDVLGQRVMRREIEAQERVRMEVRLDFSAFASALHVISVGHEATGQTAMTRPMPVK